MSPVITGRCWLSCGRHARLALDEMLGMATELLVGVAALAASAGTVNGDVDCCADLAHPLIAQASQSLRECSDRDTLN